MVELVALSKATALSPCGRQPPHLPMLVDWFGDPLGVRISSDSFMEWIDEDNLKELVCGIFTHPVRIQDSQSPTVASSSLLSNRLKAASKLELVDTMMDRLAIGCTLRNWTFAATTADADSIYDITLLGLVAQPAGFVRPRGARGPVQRRELAVLPAAHPEQKAHHVRLLLPPELLDVLVRAHVGSPSGGKQPQEPGVSLQLSPAVAGEPSGPRRAPCQLHGRPFPRPLATRCPR